MKSSERIQERYRDNMKKLPQFGDYIYSQRDPRVRELCYGERGHIAREGCGAVAIYNVMKFIGEDQDFCDVVHDMEKLKMTWLGARFGTKPFSLGRYFRLHDIPFFKMTSPVDFKAALLSHEIGIVCTWNPKLKGMHFYCVFFSPDDEEYFSANLRSEKNEFRKLKLDEISNYRFIVGYVV